MPTTSPLPYIPADALRGAYRWLTAVPGCVRITFDARRFGADVDEVSVTLRDLLYIHRADPKRFGAINECPICNTDNDDREV